MDLKFSGKESEECEAHGYVPWEAGEQGGAGGGTFFILLV